MIYHHLVLNKKKICLFKELIDIFKINYKVLLLINFLFFLMIILLINFHCILEVIVKILLLKLFKNFNKINENYFFIFSFYIHLTLILDYLLLLFYLFGILFLCCKQ